MKTWKATGAIWVDARTKKRAQRILEGVIEDARAKGVDITVEFDEMEENK